MIPDLLDKQMRDHEIYHDVRIPDGSCIIIRVDGRSFTALTKDRYARPFSSLFHENMLSVAQRLMWDFGGLLATTHSDEVSILLPKSWAMFDREAEKTATVAAGVASATFTHHADIIGAFDGRIWTSADPIDVETYFRWRHADAGRGCINSITHHALLGDGFSARKVASMLHKVGNMDKVRMMQEHGIELLSLPAWQVSGSILTWGEYTKVGVNPLTGESKPAIRRSIAVNDLPDTGEQLGDLIRDIMSGDISP